MRRGAEFESHYFNYPESWLTKVHIPGYTDPESFLPLLFETKLETLRDYYFNLLELEGMSPEDIAKVRKAYDFAVMVYETENYKPRKSGDHIMTHPLGAAILLLRMEGIIDVNIHQAAMLHDLLEDTKLGFKNAKELINEFGPEYFHQQKLDRLREEEFDPEVIEIVETVTNIKTDRLSELDVIVIQYLKDNSDLDFNQITVEQLEAYATEIKTQYALEKNILGPILKTAGDAVHNAMTADFHASPEEPDKVEQIITRSRENHATLAEALGLYRAAEIIKNNYLRLIHPEAFDRILYAHAAFNRNHFRQQILTALGDNMLRLTGMHLDYQQLNIPAAGLFEVFQKLSAESEILPNILYPRAEIWCENKGQYLMWLNFFNLLEGVEAVDATDLNAASVLKKLNYSFEGREFSLEIVLINDEKRFEYLAKPADYYRKGVEGPWLISAEAAMARLISEYRSTLEQNLDPDITAQQLAEEVQKPQISIFTPQGIEKYVEKGSTALDYARIIHTKLFARAASCIIDRKGNIIVGDLGIILEPGDIITIHDIKGKPVVLDKDILISEDDYVLLPQKLDLTNRENEQKRIIKLLRRYESLPRVRKDAEQCGQDILEQVYRHLFNEPLELRTEFAEGKIKSGVYYRGGAVQFLRDLGFNLEARDKLSTWLSAKSETGAQSLPEPAAEFDGQDQAAEVIRLAQELHHFWHSRYRLRIEIANREGVIEKVSGISRRQRLDIIIKSGSILDRSTNRGLLSEEELPMYVDVVFLNGREKQIKTAVKKIGNTLSKDLKVLELLEPDQDDQFDPLS